MVGNSTSGRSFSMILATAFQCSGSIYSVRHFRISHDRRRIGINQDDPVALFAQSLTCLRAGIIKFTGLADNYRASADNQNTFYISTFRHNSGLYSAALVRSSTVLPHHLDKAIKYGSQVMGPRTGFRMTLKTHC